jgi:protein ImuA
VAGPEGHHPESRDPENRRPESRDPENRHGDLAALRARVRELERGAAYSRAGNRAAPLGAAALDAHLPGGGLALGCLHEIEGGRAEWDDGAASGFCLALLARLLGALPEGAPQEAAGAPHARGPVLWVSRWRDLYAPGLAAFGLDPGRLILVRAGSGTEVLWAMEEALRCPRLAAVVGEVEALERSAGRRLQLAAEASGVTAFALRRPLRPARRAEAPSAAATRWRVMPAQASAQASAGRPVGGRGTFLGRPCWQVELLRCRGAAPGQWHLEWDDATGGFALAASLRDRPSAPAPGAWRSEDGAAARRLAS